MRAVILGTDFVRDTDGSFKTIETNTNIHPGVSLKYYFDVNVLDQIVSGSAINEMYFINKRNLSNGYLPEIELTPDSPESIANASGFPKPDFKQLLEYYCQNHGITFNNIMLDNHSVTVPYIEDTPNKLIIRISYDVTALIDDTYARDNWEFLKLMYDSNPLSIPKTYINDIELGFDSLGNTIRDNGVHPNYVVKKRITPADNHIWPNLYKINSIQELTQLKAGLANDEYIQEYVLNESDVLDGRLTHYRSVDLIYGPDLDILNLWNVQFSNAFELDAVCDYDDTNQVPFWERPKYIYKYNNNEKSPKISADEGTKVFLPDTGLTLLSSLTANDRVKSITIPNLPMDELSYDLSKWSGSYTNLMANFEVSSSALNHMVVTGDWTGFLINIECSGGVNFSDVSHAIILKKELEDINQNNYVVKFVEYDTLQPNDTLILFDSETNSLIEKQIVSITYTYNKVEVYSVNFEQLDLFLTVEETGNRYGLLTHNFSYDCKEVTAPCIYCSECGGGQYFYDTNLRCCRCNGPSYIPCGASYFNSAGACSSGPGSCSPGPPTAGPLWYAATCLTAGFCNVSKSDIAYKENIKLVGVSNMGINIYQFNYIDEVGLYEGVIGNELIGTNHEDALIYNTDDSLLMVDYDKIDVEFKKIN